MTVYFICTSNLAKLELESLDITRKNHLASVLDAKILLDAKGFRETIKEVKTILSTISGKVVLRLTTGSGKIYIVKIKKVKK